MGQTSQPQQLDKGLRARLPGRGHVAPSPRGWRPVLFHLPRAAEQTCLPGRPPCLLVGSGSSAQRPHTLSGVPGPWASRRARCCSSPAYLGCTCTENSHVSGVLLFCLLSPRPGSRAALFGAPPCSQEVLPPFPLSLGPPASGPAWGWWGEWAELRLGLLPLRRPRQASRALGSGRGSPPHPQMQTWGTESGPRSRCPSVGSACPAALPTPKKPTGLEVWWHAVAPAPAAGTGHRGQRPSLEGPTSAPEQAEGRARGAGTPTQARVAKRRGPEASG